MTTARLLNVSRLQEILAAQDIDAIVATAPENVTYTSGYWALSQWIRRGPQTYVVVPRRNPEDATVVAATSLLDLLSDQDVWPKNIRRFGYFQIDVTGGPYDELDQRQVALLNLPEDKSAIDALIQALNGLTTKKCRIAVDELGLMPGGFQEIAAQLPNAEIVPGAAVLRKIRAVKTPEEVRRLRYAAQAAERSIERSIEAAVEMADERR